MSQLYVRQTYWNIPCNNTHLSQGIQQLRKVFNVPNGSGTTQVKRLSFSNADWYEFKVATYSGRQVLLLLEAGDDNAQFCDLDRPLIRSLVLHQWERRFRSQKGGSMYTYRLYQYIPFRSSAYQQYCNAGSAAEQLTVLQEHLSYHIRELAERLAWPEQQQLRCGHIKHYREKKARLGGVQHLAFDLVFSTNLFIPEYVGLGRGVIKGHGVIRPERTASAGQR